MIKKHYGKSPIGVHPSGKPKFEKSSEFKKAGERSGFDMRGLNESESKWNAVDVSRTAEKEIDNKEWNERTAKKLAILKALNAAGKFKKDWDEEKLQDWVDQNYSWEKLSQQFKLNESYSAMFETMQQGDYTAIEQGWDGLSIDEKKNILDAALINPAEADYKDFDQLKAENDDFESGVANYLGIDEGTCGYGKDGKVNPRDTSKLTPGGLKSMPADTRTMTMIREVIKKEVKKLHEKIDHSGKTCDEAHPNTSHTAWEKTQK